ncbi:MAG: ArgE/DapE family deacylase [Burkholderiales bacterium]|nr:ArgE/DapE family deacylase [Burkholderiales bacterium]
MDMSTEAGIAADAIGNAVQALREPAVERLCALVREPSLLGAEASAQALMREHFARLGLRVDEFEVDEARLRDHPGWSPSLVPYAGRRNVVGVHHPKGPVQGRSLILNGHIDVVPVGAERLWQAPPFAPVVQAGRVYGRGAGDMKAGLIAMLTAFEALQRLGLEPAASVYLQSVIEEECTGNGALACLVEGYRAEAALIPEPIPAIMTAQMGVMWIGLEVWGVPVHAAVAQTGVAAIEFAQHLCAKLKELETQWNDPAHRHPHFAQHDHPINFNVGRIDGGEWPSSVPTHCRVDVRVGFYPGLKPAQVRALLEAALRAAYEAHPKKDSLRYEIVYRGFQAEGMLVDLNQPMIRLLKQCHHDVAGGQAPLLASTATTDARFFQLYGGIPATCYGPQAGNTHGIDEWVSIDSLIEVAQVYALFIARWCRLNPV